MKGPKAFEQTIERQEAIEVICGYEVMFEKGFQWVKGGKLPGICACFPRCVGVGVAMSLEGC